MSSREAVTAPTLGEDGVAREARAAASRLRMLLDRFEYALGVETGPYLETDGDCVIVDDSYWYWRDKGKNGLRRCKVLGREEALLTAARALKARADGLEHWKRRSEE